jgi:hypothetical protein
MTAKPEYDMKVTEKERKLIERWRKLGFGVIERVFIEDGQPVRIKETERNIKL